MGVIDESKKSNTEFFTILVF